MKPQNRFRRRAFFPLLLVSVSVIHAAEPNATLDAAKPEQKAENREAPVNDPASAVSRIWINPGPQTITLPEVENPYAGDPQAIEDGKRLYGWYHCAGCHAPNAGGAYGPSLRDPYFIYGGDALSMYQSIWHGRPNGMPTWAGKIPPDEIWKIIAFIHSLHDKEPDAVTRGDN